MPSGKIDGPGLAMLGIGSVLMYAGIKGYSMLAVVQNLVTGKPILTGVVASSLVDNTVSASTTTVDAGSTSASGSKPGGNRGIGMAQAEALGWTGAEWDALDKLWKQESAWNNRADNPSSHAYGIPQALPYTKMPQSAWPESKGGHSDASAQIAWGLSYIASRYGTPSMAWAHEVANNWY